MAGMKWLVSLYDRRIVNVNVNVIVAGLLAMGITVLVMHFAERSGLLSSLQGPPRRLRRRRMMPRLFSIATCRRWRALPICSRSIAN